MGSDKYYTRTCSRPFYLACKACLALFLVFSLLTVWENFTSQAALQAQGLVKNSELLGISPRLGNIPEHRMCGDFNGKAEQTPDSAKKNSSYSAQRMQSALSKQLLKMKKVLNDINSTHRSFVKAYPQFKKYYEAEIEDLPEKEDRLHKYSNLKITVALHYNAPGELDCVVIDAYERRIYEDNDYTHKLFRFPYSDIGKLSLESLSYNYKRETLLTSYSLDDQLLVLRTVFYSLLKALYKMDMILASYNYYQTKINRWQGDI